MGNPGAKITGIYQACLAFTWVLEMQILVFMLVQLNHLLSPLSVPLINSGSV